MDQRELEYVKRLKETIEENIQKIAAGVAKLYEINPSRHEKSYRDVNDVLVPSAASCIAAMEKDITEAEAK